MYMSKDRSKPNLAYMYWLNISLRYPFVEEKNKIEVYGWSAMTSYSDMFDNLKLITESSKVLGANRHFVKPERYVYE